MNIGLRNRRLDHHQERRAFPLNMYSEDHSKKYLASSTSKRFERLFKKNLHALHSAFFIVLFILLIHSSVEWTLSNGVDMDLSDNQPRAVQLYGNIALPLNLSLVVVDEIPDIENDLPTRRRSITLQKFVQRIATSDDNGESDDDNDDEECVTLADWQQYVFPTCNKIHEHELVRKGWYINSGYNRDVWGLFDDWGEEIVLKTLAEKHPFSPFMIDLQRIDALISERTTASKYITNVYAYCK